MAEFMEKNLKSGMEELQIDESVSNSTEEKGSKMKNRRRGCPRRCHGDSTTDIARQQWRKMRHQRMMMQRQAAMMNHSGWLGGPSFCGPPAGFPSSMMHGMGPHWRHGVYRGPMNMHMAGPMMMGGGASAYNPGLLPMMFMMQGKPKFMDKMKCRASGDDCPENGDSKAEKCCKTSKNEEMPPFMMPWMMFQGPNFRKFMNKQHCKNSKSKEAESETENRSEESEGSPKKEGSEKRKKMMMMRRMMAMQGGSPGMFPGAWCPPWMMQGGMHRRRGNCKGKGKGKCQDSGTESPSSCDEVEIIPEIRSDTEVTAASIVEEFSDDNQEMDQQEPEGQEVPAELQKGEVQTENGERSRVGEKNPQRQNHHRRWMREMMESGGFPAMWMMMSQQGGGFPKMKPRKNKNKESGNCEN